MAPDNEVFSISKDWLLALFGVLSGILTGVFAWAWNRNEKEHEMLRERTENIKQNTSDGYSVLNDRVMEHIDGRVAEVRDENRRKMDNMNDNIVKLFDNAERDRAAVREEQARQAQQSADRHIELLSAIHVGLASKADK